MPQRPTPVEELTINAIRFLSADAVQAANSGHPGAPMGMAPMAYTLFSKALKFNPKDPAWPDRDRFVLSAGHASALLYSLLHLYGYDVSLDEVRSFRQWGSITPGHPEYGETPGVEVTSGPLGQGFAHGVGMAVAEAWMAAHFNAPGHEIVDHYTFAICSDGDLQEGVSAEAASLAGTLGLGKLIYLYDKNDIQIEGATSVVFQENVGARFEAYGWQVIGPIDGHDVASIEAAIRQAKSDASRPSLIICQTIIGYGSPVQGTAKAHGEPLGADGLKQAKENLGWPADKSFHVPDEVRDHTKEAGDRGAGAQKDWDSRFAAYARDFPEVADEFLKAIRMELPEDWDAELDGLFPPDSKPTATRNASGKAINALAARLPGLIGGSADLGPSNKTVIDDEGDFGRGNYGARNMHFGVREHTMGSIAGGMALHGGVIPYTGTFLVFSDYMRPPMRLAALMEQRVIYVFTHDSIGLGEDGPTHQPVEHLMAMRAVPNLVVLRPAEATETAEAWRVAIRRTNGPTALCFTRQNLPIIDRTECGAAAGVAKGAYVLWESGSGAPEVIFMASGSEVEIAMEAAKTLAADGVAVRLVSVPSWELFDAQPQAYRDEVLPPSVEARVSIEAGITLGWERYVGPKGAAIGVDRFGASAPYETLYREFGLTADAVVEKARALLGM